MAKKQPIKQEEPRIDVIPNEEDDDFALLRQFGLLDEPVDQPVPPPPPKPFSEILTQNTPLQAPIASINDFFSPVTTPLNDFLNIPQVQFADIGLSPLQMGAVHKAANYLPNFLPEKGLDDLADFYKDFFTQRGVPLGIKLPDIPWINMERFNHMFQDQILEGIEATSEKGLPNAIRGVDYITGIDNVLFSGIFASPPRLGADEVSFLVVNPESLHSSRKLTNEVVEHELGHALDYAALSELNKRFVIPDLHEGEDLLSKFITVRSTDPINQLPARLQNESELTPFKYGGEPVFTVLPHEQLAVMAEYFPNIPRTWEDLLGAMNEFITGGTPSGVLKQFIDQIGLIPRR